MKTTEAQRKACKNYYYKNREKCLKQQKEYSQDPNIKQNIQKYEKEYRKENLEKIKENRKEWREKNKEDIKNKRLQKKYNLTQEQIKQMINNQNNCCAICKEEFKETKKRNGIHPGYCIDHCHKTGKVRGLLCDICNRALGHYESYIENELIIKFNKYIEEKE